MLIKIALISSFIQIFRLWELAYLLFPFIWAVAHHMPFFFRVMGRFSQWCTCIFSCHQLISHIYNNISINERTKIYLDTDASSR